MKLLPPQIANPHDVRGPNHSDLSLPTGYIAQNYDRRVPLVDNSVLTTQREVMMLLTLPVGAVVSTISFFCQNTAGSALTNQWFSLRNASRQLIKTTADDGSTAWAQNSEKQLYLSRTVTDAVATSSSAVITSATAAFTSSDVGKQITFMGAGAAGVPFGTTASRVTISTVDSATQITASTTASTSVASGGTLHIATPYTATATAQYYVGIMVKGTVPTLYGFASAGSAAVWALPPIMVGVDGTNTSLTDPTTAPSTSASLTTKGNCPWVVLA